MVAWFWPPEGSPQVARSNPTRGKNHPPTHPRHTHVHVHTPTHTHPESHARVAIRPARVKEPNQKTRAPRHGGSEELSVAPACVAGHGQPDLRANTAERGEGSASSLFPFCPPKVARLLWFFTYPRARHTERLFTLDLATTISKEKPESPRYSRCRTRTSPAAPAVTTAK